MQKHNYTFFYNTVFLILYTCILFTLFVKSGQFADNNIIAKREYFTTILFVINVAAISFLTINRHIKFSLQDFLAFLLMLYVSFNQYVQGEAQESRYEMFLLLLILYFCCRIIFFNIEKSGRFPVICLLIYGIAQSMLGILFKTYPLNSNNWELYKIPIEYETGHRLKFVNDSLYLGTKFIDHYTFQKNYYFVAGDNVMNSSDSRHFGFVPEEFIIGVVDWIRKKIKQ